MQDQLDELNGDTGKSKAACVLVFLLVLAALMGTFTGMVKADVGGVASNLLAPAIGNVPVLKNILPKDLQAADPAQTADAVDSTQTADTQTADTQNAAGAVDPTQAADTQTTAGVADPTQTADAQNAAGAADPTQTADAQTAAGVVDPTQTASAQNAAGTQSTTDPAQTAGTQGTTDPTQTAGTQNAVGTSTTDPTQTAGTQNVAGTSTTDPTQAAGAQGTGATDPTQQDTEAAALADYVKTYSDMKPKDAASVFDGMMPDQMKLVVKILKNMSAEQRSAIISKMNVQNASDITVEMNKELP